MIWQVKAVLLAAHCNKICFFWRHLLTNFLSGLACKVWIKMQLHHLLMGACNRNLQLAFFSSSQRSLHNAPIFRLLLKVAVKGTHQCDFTNFWGSLGIQHMQWFECIVWHNIPEGGKDRDRMARLSIHHPVTNCNSETMCNCMSGSYLLADMWDPYHLLHGLNAPMTQTVLIWEWDTKPKAAATEHNGKTFHPSPCYKL